MPVGVAAVAWDGGQWWMCQVEGSGGLVEGGRGLLMEWRSVLGVGAARGARWFLWDSEIEVGWGVTHRFGMGCFVLGG